MSNFNYVESKFLILFFNEKSYEIILCIKKILYEMRIKTGMKNDTFFIAIK